jgi:hypothetical protein
MIEKKIEGETIGKTCCNLCTRSTKQPKRAYFRYCRRKENSFPAFGFFKSYRTDMPRTAMVVWLRPDFASLRYMHTTVEMVHRDDVENVIKLIYETILKLENNETFSYFK